MAPHQTGISDDDATEIRRQFQEVADRQAITDLVSRQGLWLDEQRFDDAHTILTEDATAATPAGEAGGRERLTEQARRNHTAFARTQHVTTNVLVDLDGDRATVRANLVATYVHYAEASDGHYRIGARYRFEARRTPAGWRFSRVEVVPVRAGAAAEQSACLGRAHRVSG